ncbi:MAG: hypothetical protein ACKOWK_03380, partial [Micrococcales bacterium]
MILPFGFEHLFRTSVLIIQLYDHPATLCQDFFSTFSKICLETFRFSNKVSIVDLKKIQATGSDIYLEAAVEQKLTQRQQAVLDAIRTLREARDMPPTLREIAEAVGLKS